MQPSDHPPTRRVSPSKHHISSHHPNPWLIHSNVDLQLDFTFSLSTNSPGQCSSITVDWLDNATSPALHGMIPGGSAWDAGVGGSSGSGTWQVDVRQGTQFLLMMTGSGPRGFGGSTNLITAGGGDGGCISSGSPAANTSFSGRSVITPGQNNGTGGGGGGGGGDGGNGNGNGNGGGNNDGGGGGGGTSTGAIVGGTLGGVAFLVLLGVLAICLVRRKAKNRRHSTHSVTKNYGLGGEKKSGERHRTTMDLLRGGSQAENGTAGGAAAGAGSAGAIAMAAADGAGDRDETTSLGRSDVEGGEYEPSPFRYPSPPPAPTSSGAGTSVTGSEAGHGADIGGMGAGAAAAAAAGGNGNEKRRSRLTMVTELEPDDQPSPPSRFARSSQAPSVSDQASVGHAADHGASTARRPSTHKGGLPGESGMGSASGIAAPSTGRESAAGGVNPEAPGTPQEARFVQHEDAGEIM